MSWASRPDRARTLVAAVRARPSGRPRRRIDAGPDWRLAVVERRICMATCTAWSSLSCRWYWSIRPTSADGLVAGAAAGAAQQGLGQLVQAELVHLAGQADLGVGVEPQAEEPLGRLAGAVDVARSARPPAAPAPRGASGSRLSSGWTASTIARAPA